MESDEKKYYWDVLKEAYKNTGKTTDPDLIMEMARLLVKADRDCKYAESVIKSFIPEGVKYTKVTEKFL